MLKSIFEKIQNEELGIGSLDELLDDVISLANTAKYFDNKPTGPEGPDAFGEAYEFIENNIRNKSLKEVKIVFDDEMLVAFYDADYKFIELGFKNYSLDILLFVYLLKKFKITKKISNKGDFYLCDKRAYPYFLSYILQFGQVLSGFLSFLKKLKGRNLDFECFIKKMTRKNSEINFIIKKIKYLDYDRPKNNFRNTVTFYSAYNLQDAAKNGDKIFMDDGDIKINLSPLLKYFEGYTLKDISFIFHLKLEDNMLSLYFQPYEESIDDRKIKTERFTFKVKNNSPEELLESTKKVLKRFFDTKISEDLADIVLEKLYYESKSKPSSGDEIHTKGSNGEYYATITSIKKTGIGYKVCIKADGKKDCSIISSFDDWEYDPFEGVWDAPNYTFSI